MGGACSAYGGSGTYRVLVGKPEVKILLGRTRCRWENNIKMDLARSWIEGRDCTGLARNRDKLRGFVIAAMNLRVP